MGTVTESQTGGRRSSRTDRRGAKAEPASGRDPGFLAPFRGLSLAEHLAGLALLLVVLLPPIALNLALTSARHSADGTAARIVGLVGALATISILVVLAPLAGLRRRDLWQSLIPFYGEYYVVAFAWRGGAAILRLAQQREEQRHPVEATEARVAP